MIFNANGKLLLTAEYAVLDGAKALCLPCKRGQTLQVDPHEKHSLFWEAFLPEQQIWFSTEIDLSSLSLISYSEKEPALFLVKILQAIRELNPDFSRHNGAHAKTHLQFPKDWGLGSSSTLISLLAEWAKVNPYALLEKTFGGSGYDIACATEKQPLFYQRNEKSPLITPVDFFPNFHASLYFVYLNKKQNSREGIKRYRAVKKEVAFIEEMSDLTQEIATATTLSSFEKLLFAHEKALSNYLKIKTVKELLFPDYTGGLVKSLGAWGGDFILVSATEQELSYFKAKGYSTIIKYADMVY